MGSSCLLLDKLLCSLVFFIPLSQGACDAADSIVGSNRAHENLNQFGTVSPLEKERERVELEEDDESIVAPFSMLQDRVSGLRSRVSQRAPLPKGNLQAAVTLVPSKEIRGCHRIDARLMTHRDLQNISEPTILEHAWEVLDGNTWAYADFEELGPFGAIPMYARNVLHMDYKSGFNDDLNISMHEALNYPGHETLWIYPEETGPLIASWAAKNRDSPHTGPLSHLLKEMTPDFFLTFEEFGKWTRMHTHEGTLFTQVAGRKGWIFGDNTAWIGKTLANTGNGGGPVPDHLLSKDDTCNLFLNAVVPESIADRPSSFRKCETLPGEAIFWNSFCDGECGWWHGTCGLEGWNAGKTHIGFIDHTVKGGHKH